MQKVRIWVLGAPDPEMAAIEGLLRECGERVVYARAADGERVRPGQQAAVIHIGDATTVYTVECDPPLACGEPEDEPDVGQVTLDGRRYMAARRCVGVRVIRIDHHRPGDPGYGRPPGEFLEASSIGQVIIELARLRRLRFRPLTKVPGAYPGGSFILRDWEGFGAAWLISDGASWRVVPPHLVLTGAADHCLGAAYRGECPGIDPNELMRWRAESRAKFQGRTVEEVLADVERAQAALRAAPELVLAEADPSPVRWRVRHSAVIVRDMRQPADRQPTRELPEAAARLGIGYVSGPLVGPDGRRKITCSGTTEQVRAFLECWAPSQGLVDAYGDPARGFAGAYLPTEGPC